MTKTTTQERIRRLEEHLERENPVLAGAVKSFQELDVVARKLGLMSADDSFATRVSWWPVISVLGTFSAGKSTFLNQYTGRNLQRTGNQAVDDKFTVICYGADDDASVLPGLALDSDPRFPFYQISHEIEQVAEGEGRRVDSYLQLKTCRAEPLRGKIFIDSPGFDADAQRSSTLLITDHIIDLSDLVLVFFDARHPEPGAMGDTLTHLVGDTVSRADASKFLYILNQIDNAAREDNPEEVVAAWQRALAQHGLTAGRFYRIYARDAALPMEDEQVRDRLRRKRDEDLADIEARIEQVEVERAYRVVGVLEKTARHLRDEIVPRLVAARRSWRRRTLWGSVALLAVLAAGFLAWSIAGGYWDGLRFTPIAELSGTTQIIVTLVVVAVLAYLHVLVKRLAGRTVARSLQRDASVRGDDRELLQKAFAGNRKAWWRSLASSQPRGWTRRTRRQLDAVLAQADRFVQALNDRYANPSGTAPRQAERQPH
ncbi:MAG: dynamin family protein [Pseudomonadota bacterium]